MSGKLSIGQILSNHLRSFRGYSRFTRVKDVLAFVAIPVTAGISTLRGRDKPTSGR